MPENETHGNEEQEMQSSELSVSIETALERFERERLTRRQALKKFGITAGMATFALFSVDDLARIVGKALEQRASDNRIAGQIAKEFQEAGIALASGGPSGGGGGGDTTCQHCCNQEFLDLCACLRNTSPSSPARSACINNASYNFQGCYVAHCKAGATCTTPTGNCP